MAATYTVTIGQPGIAPQVRVLNDLEALKGIYYVAGLPKRNYHHFIGYCEKDFTTLASKLTGYVKAKNKNGLIDQLKKCITKRIDQMFYKKGTGTTNADEQGHIKMVRMLQSLHDFILIRNINDIVDITLNSRPLGKGGYAFDVRYKVPAPVPAPVVPAPVVPAPVVPAPVVPAPVVPAPVVPAPVPVPAPAPVPVPAPAKGLNPYAAEYVPRTGGAKKTRKAKRCYRKATRSNRKKTMRKRR